MAEKDLTARIAVEADDAQPIDDIETSLLDLSAAGEQTARGLRRAEDAAERTGRALGQVDDAAEEVASSLRSSARELRDFVQEGQGVGSLGTLFSDLKGSVTNLDFGGFVDRILSFGDQVVDASERQAEALAKVEGALRSTGRSADFTTEELRALAGGLSEVTAVSDEAVLEGQAVLLTFEKLGKEIFPEVAERSLDAAQALGKDVSEAAQLLGKALNDPVQGLDELADSGIRFTAAQRQAIQAAVEAGKTYEAQKIVLRELEERIGGAAREARNTWTGAMDAAANASEDFLQKVGESGLTGALGRLALRFTETAGQGDGFAVRLGQALGSLVELLSGAATAVQAGFQAVAGAVGIGIAGIAEGFLSLNEFLSKQLARIPGLEKLAGTFHARLSEIRDIVRDFRRNVQTETEKDLRRAQSSFQSTLDHIVAIWRDGGQKTAEASRTVTQAVQESAEKVAAFIDVVVVKTDEAGQKLITTERITQEAARAMTLEEIRNASPRLQEYVRQLKEADEGLGKTQSRAKDAAEALKAPADQVDQVGRSVAGLRQSAKDLAAAQEEAGKAARNQATGLGQVAETLEGSALKEGLADLEARLRALNGIDFGPLVAQLHRVKDAAREAAQAVASIDTAAEGDSAGAGAEPG